MKSDYIIFICVLLIFGLASCQNSLSPDESNLIGAWIDGGYQDDVRVLKRSAALKNDCGGIIFNINHTLVERKNSGWCGTPPISYSNYDGTWTMTGENHLEIIAGYWGGIDTVEYEIVQLSQFELNLKYIY